MKKIYASPRYFLLKDYIEGLNRTQNTDFIPILYPEINNPSASKLEREINREKE